MFFFPLDRANLQFSHLCVLVLFTIVCVIIILCVCGPIPLRSFLALTASLAPKSGGWARDGSSSICVSLSEKNNEHR